MLNVVIIDVTNAIIITIIIIARIKNVNFTVIVVFMLFTSPSWRRENKRRGQTIMLPEKNIYQISCCHEQATVLGSGTRLHSLYLSLSLTHTLTAFTSPFSFWPFSVGFDTSIMDSLPAFLHTNAAIDTATAGRYNENKSNRVAWLYTCGLPFPVLKCVSVWVCVLLLFCWLIHTFSVRVLRTFRAINRVTPPSFHARTSCFAFLDFSMFSHCLLSLIIIYLERFSTSTKDNFIY